MLSKRVWLRLVSWFEGRRGYGTIERPLVPAPKLLARSKRSIGSFSQGTLLQRIWPCRNNSFPKLAFYSPHPSSPLIFACLKYFIPTHATTTHTHAITPVSIIKAG